MSTPAAEVRPRKHYTTAEIEAELASAPHLAAQPSCQDLCLSLQEDADTLQNLQDFPANRRAGVRMAILRDMRAISLQLKREGCPGCD